MSASDVAASYSPEGWTDLLIDAQVLRAQAAVELAALTLDPPPWKYPQLITGLWRKPITLWPQNLQDAYYGRLPADALSTEGRHLVVRALHRRGLTDLDIARKTRMSFYTTVRIRSELGLVAHPSTEQAWWGAVG